MIDGARRKGAPVPYSANTPYLNTITLEKQERHPGDRAIEHRIRSVIRWNAMAIVLRANKTSSELGGHIASFQSSALLYDTGFMHFWHAPSAEHGGDLIFVQGHVAPGIYARSFLEGRLTEERLLKFRQEVDGDGISSYPHPWLMPDYWQFPTVSMGLGPLMAIYQARFLKYINARGFAPTENRKVWAFLGDGEMDEPESTGAISLAAREKLDNLIFVINCNLQRLDGPVRGNGKVIQELEGQFRGAGWNVIKLIWGSGWDELLIRDTSGILLRTMEETVDGEYQDYKSKNGAYVRQHFFGKHPELKAMVAGLSDDQIGGPPRRARSAQSLRRLCSGGEAQGAAHRYPRQDSEGLRYGRGRRGPNITHQQKKMGENSLREFRDRFDLTISTSSSAKLPFIRFAEDSPELKYLRERRAALGGSLPSRRRKSDPSRSRHCRAFEGSSRRRTGVRSRRRWHSCECSTLSCATNRLASASCRSFRTKPVPSAWRVCSDRFGIFSQVGQLYTPEDANQLMFYKEDKDGQLLQEGINEAGAMSSWIAAATSYATTDVPMIPFYIYYSMFGFQRIGDLIWAAGDMRRAAFSSAARPAARPSTARGCSTRTATAHPLLDDSELHLLRSDLLL